MTTAAKHTAEPWTTNGSIVRTVDGNNMTDRKIATVHGGFGEAEKIANARLIAAAPELLEALKIVRKKSYLPTHCAAIIDAAIAKAEGGAA